eukprot:XP_013987550.1 PREDICTED: zinc finger CCCH domain-containing protein 11A-like [Salmo salar]
MQMIPANPQLCGVIKAETPVNVPRPTNLPVVINRADDDEDEDERLDMPSRRAPPVGGVKVKTLEEIHREKACQDAGPGTEGAQWENPRLCLKLRKGRSQESTHTAHQQSCHGPEP